eukprot:4926321-Pyramimonas_sp.AAC.1
MSVSVVLRCSVTGSSPFDPATLDCFSSHHLSNVRELTAVMSDYPGATWWYWHLEDIVRIDGMKISQLVPLPSDVSQQPGVVTLIGQARLLNNQRTLTDVLGAARAP